MSFSKVSKTSPMTLTAALALTEPEAAKARNEGDLAYFHLLPRDCWKLKIHMQKVKSKSKKSK